MVLKLERYIEKNSDRIEDYAKGACITLFIIYGIYQFIVFMNYSALVPDEIWFLGEARNFSIFNRSAPPLKYGSIYWWIIGTISKPSLIRFLAYLLYMLIPVVMGIIYKKWTLRLVGLLVYLSFPYAFWTGKLIGPEIFSIFSVAMCLFFIEKKPIPSSIFAGIAIGIKIITLPVVIFYLIKIKYNKENLSLILLILFFINLGLILSNPFNLDLYFKSLSSFESQSIGATFAADNLIFSMLTEEWKWDNVISSSFSQVICHPILLMYFLLIVLLVSRIMGITLLIFSIITGFLVLQSADKLAWYWFSFVPVMLYSITVIGNKLHFKMYIYLCLLIIFAILNFCINVPYSVLQAAEKFKQIAMIENFPKECINNAIKSYEPDVILDKIDFTEFNYSRPNNTIILNGPMDKITHNGKAMALIGSRLIANPWHLEHMVPNGSHLIKYGICGNVFIFVNK